MNSYFPFHSKCLIHSCWFTIYPTGWLPFGRRILVDLDPKGEAVIAEDCWEDTGFAAVVEKAKKKHWPETCAELLRSISKNIFYYATRKTQIRHVQGGVCLLGLNADTTGWQENVRLGLGIDQKSYQEANARIRDGPELSALGAACTGLLRSFQQPPLVRLHRLDENNAREISGLLGFLRGLERSHAVSIMLTHHASKRAGSRPGQSLRGSSDLHAFGDSNLYLSRSANDITLTIEHRAAASIQPLTLLLDDSPCSMYQILIPVQARINSSAVAFIKELMSLGLDMRAGKITVRVQSRALD